MVSNIPIKPSLQSKETLWIYGSWLERWIFAAKSLPSGSKAIAAASPRGPWGQPEGGTAGSQLLPFSSPSKETKLHSGISGFPSPSRWWIFGDRRTVLS